MQIKAKTYKILDHCNQIYIPALATLYLTLGKIWEWESPSEISGTILAINLFCGTCLKAFDIKQDDKPCCNLSIKHKIITGVLYLLLTIAILFVWINK